MARPREFDREVALEKAIGVFHAKGFSATSTDDLLAAMEIGRQSLYNTFGDKRALYIEALQTYQRKTVEGHLSRLNAPDSPLVGINNLLVGLIADGDDVRALGCMGVGSVGEFGVTDAELMQMRNKIGVVLGTRLLERIKEGQQRGEIKPGISPNDAAGFVQITMTGLQLAARGGGGAKELRKVARFAADRLRAS